MSEHDEVEHPKHYTSSPSGIECIDVVEHLPFCRGNAIKYLWRAGQKGEGDAATIRDLEKARWYVEREIASLRKKSKDAPTHPRFGQFCLKCGETGAPHIIGSC